jgi:hypothetical protein
MEVSDVRRRVRAVIDEARRQAAIRRVKVDHAAREYETFLTERALPVIRQLADALTAEGFRFKFSTPAGSVRLFSDRAPDDYVELTLDYEPSGGDPMLLIRSNRGRGSRQVTSERVAHDATKLSELTEVEVLELFLHELEPFVER